MSFCSKTSVFSPLPKLVKTEITWTKINSTRRGPTNKKRTIFPGTAAPILLHCEAEGRVGVWL